MLNICAKMLVHLTRKLSDITVRGQMVLEKLHLGEPETKTELNVTHKLVFRAQFLKRDVIK